MDKALSRPLQFAIAFLLVATPTMTAARSPAPAARGITQDQAGTQAKPTPRLIPLFQYWSKYRRDHTSVATKARIRATQQSSAKYKLCRIQGYVAASPGRGLVPIRLYWNAVRGDHVIATTDDDSRHMATRGYRFVETQGYAFAKPSSDTVPLKLYWHSDRKDHIAVSTVQFESAAKASDYKFVCLLGHIRKDEPGPKRSTRYLGHSADDDDRDGWFDAAQGIANGDPRYDPYWFFSKNSVSLKDGLADGKREKKLKNMTRIFRVPYTEHLGHRFALNAVKIRLPGPGGRFCQHVGDIDYHVHRGVGYIVAGYDNCGGGARIAFFRARDIHGDRVLDPAAILEVGKHQGSGAPWVSVLHDGSVFSSPGGAEEKRSGSKVIRYRIDWNEVARSRRMRRLKLESPPSWIPLVDRSNKLMHLPYKQGADFSTDGRYLYVAVGVKTEGSGKPARRIHVFEFRGHSLVHCEQSTKHGRFSFQVAKPKFLGPIMLSAEEPEGVSYFDVNDIWGYHPKMRRGELFVMLLNKDGGYDNLWLKHYTRF